MAHKGVMPGIGPKLEKKLERDLPKYRAGIKRMMKACKQMHEKKGPLYEKNLKTNYTRIVREMARLGISIPDPGELCRS